MTHLAIEEQDASAELTAIIQMNGTLSFGNGQPVLDISTENAAIARRIYELIKVVYQCHVELLVRKKCG